MKKILYLFMLTVSMYLKISCQENAAPSIHLFYGFNSNDFVLKMNKIKITESAPASYFEVNSFTLGYTGLQQTTIDYSGQKNINLFSVWDPDTKQNILSKVEYMGTNTISDRFGGEGNGWKTINPIKWEKNVWYTIVTRAWKSNDKLYIANFIQNTISGEWIHTATMSIPDPNSYLNWYNNAFLENWDGFNPLHDGRYKRSAYFKDAWNLNLQGRWEKNNVTRFSANGDVDKARNGIYHNNFKAFYDKTEDAYCLQHGGDTKRSDEFGDKRELNLPTQNNQGEFPLIVPPIVSKIDLKYKNDSIKVEWVVDSKNNPQLSYELDILSESGQFFYSSKDTIPNKRSFEIQSLLKPGTYKARLYIIDIFGQKSQALESNSIIVKNNNLSFDLSDSICGKFGDVINIPIRVKNFNNIRSFQFTVFISDTTVGKIVSISKGDLNGDMLFSYQNASTSGVIWDNINSISLNDNHTIIIISIKLQNSSSVSQIFINNNLVDIYVENEEGKSLNPVLLSGSFCSKPSFKGTISKLYKNYNTTILKKDDSNNRMSIFPNPTSGQIAFKGDTGFEIIDIYTSTGTALGIKTPLSFGTTVDLSKYPSGIYQVKINQKSPTLNVFKYLTISKL